MGIRAVASAHRSVVIGVACLLAIAVVLGIHTAFRLKSSSGGFATMSYMQPQTAATSAMRRFVSRQVNTAVAPAAAAISASGSTAAASASAPASAVVSTPASLPVAVAMMVTTSYCLPAWVLYKSIRAVSSDVEVAVLVDDQEDMAALMREPSCALLLETSQHMRVHRIATEELPAVAKIGRDNWRRAMNKLGALGLSMYSRVLLMDADTLLLASPYDWFDVIDEGSDWAAATDQYDGCTRREVANNGISVFRPSRGLHMSARTVLLETTPCITSNWGYSEQEVLNCMCGTATDKLKQKRHDIRCRILPYSYGATTWVTHCREYDVSEVRAIHYAADFKPWTSKYATSTHPMISVWRCVRDTPIDAIATTCMLTA